MQALRGAGASFAQALGIMGGDGSMENVIATPAGAALRKKLGEDGARPGDHAAELLALGLVASRAAIRRHWNIWRRRGCSHPIRVSTC